MTRTCLLLVAAMFSGCTTLGPMPATTGVAAVPTGRPGVELQGGLAPGYYLSAATQDSEHKGEAGRQLLALIEPDHWIGTRGLIAGARSEASGGERTIEPFVGFRERLSELFSLAVIGHGTVIEGSERGASYRAARFGGEIAADALLIAPVSWLELHAQAAVAAVYLDARGTYCVGADGTGVDCAQDASDRVVDGTARGVFPAATASLAIDFARLPSGVFHGGRIALVGTTGLMPQIRDGMETAGVRYHSLGLSLTLGFGSAR
jgi:hypothetical protein